MSYVIHKIPGRVRIKVPTIRYSPGGAAVVAASLKSLPGVGAVSCNPVTGSVVVTYNEDMISVEKIVGTLKAQGHLNAAPMGFEASVSESFTPAKAGQIMAKALLQVALDAALKNTPFSVLTLFI